MRAPNEQEIKALLDETVREEIAVREAMAMGLDRDDTVIRRRLRQKLEFLAEDADRQAPPTDAELQAWLDAHPEQFRSQPRVSFRQVHLGSERRRDSLEADARKAARAARGRGPRGGHRDAGRFADAARRAESGDP